MTDERFLNGSYKDGDYVLSVGRLSEQKNHFLLIDAFEKMERPKNLVLKIYGEGPLKEKLEDYIRSKSLEKKVFLMGNSDNLLPIYENASFFVLSSNYEGMPNALIEALSVGLPSIATDCPCGGPKQIISNHVNGVLVPTNDIDALASEMSRLSSSKETRLSYSRASKISSKAFEPSEVLKDWFVFFKEVCNHE